LGLHIPLKLWLDGNWPVGFTVFALGKTIFLDGIHVFTANQCVKNLRLKTFAHSPKDAIETDDLPE